MYWSSTTLPQQNIPIITTAKHSRLFYTHGCHCIQSSTANDH